jgi:ADP-ribose pyrophosphatase YjhB (NUDIX family)
MTLGAFAVILNGQNEILLCHRRDKDLWNLPGGRVEDGESPWEAAVRETKEEVRLDVALVRLLGVYYKTKENDMVFMFLVKPINDLEPATSLEVDYVSFYSIRNLPPNTAPKQRERLLELFGNDNLEIGVVLREQ